MLGWLLLKQKAENMHRLVLAMALILILTGCKTTGLGIPSKFDSGKMDVMDGLSKFAELILGVRMDR